MKKNTALLILLLFFLYPIQMCSQASYQYDACEIYFVNALSNTKILPDTYPINALSDQTLNITACPGEYQPGSFVVHARQDINSLTAVATDLSSGGASIPASAVDLRVVKCWWQAGVAIDETTNCLLTSELLLKDDSLVSVDLSQKQNFLRNADGSYVCISNKDSSNIPDNLSFQDAATLQPVDIAAGTNKQFWVTLHVPDNATAGTYQGTITLNSSNTPAMNISLVVTVLPFSLEKPVLEYSIYYTGQLTGNGTGSIGCLWKSPQQYLAEMVNLKAHGILNPTFCQETYPHLVAQEMQLRKQAGLSPGPFYTMGVCTGNPTSTDQLNALKSTVQTWMSMAQANGYTDCYFMGIDEAKGTTLTSQRPAWQAVHDAGGKVFVACDYMVDGQPMNFALMGDLLDLAVQKNAPDPQIAAQYHGVGHKIFCYSNPQMGEEQPETYRRNFGLVLWKGGYDGAMNFAYQYDFGHIWDDFDNTVYRDHVCAYPTSNGVIDTIQWEGFREAIDDVRYLTTLLKYIQNAPASQAALAAQAQQFVNNIDPSGDLDALRKNMINWILKLSNNELP